MQMALSRTNKNYILIKAIKSNKAIKMSISRKKTPSKRTSKANTVHSILQTRQQTLKSHEKCIEIKTSFLVLCFQFFSYI